MARPTPASSLVAPKGRLITLLVIMAVGFGAIVVRLTFVQGFSARRYADYGASQRIVNISLPAERGAILDRNLAELALSTRRQTVWADPKSIKDPAAAARILAPLLETSESALRAKLSTDASFVYLARKVEDRMAAAVKSMKIEGVGFLEEPKRIVPSEELAAPVIGQVGTDDEGLSGVEAQYEKELTGRPGELLVERDPGGNDIAAGLRQLTPSARGDNLVLTLDRAMQYEAERALAASIVSSKAKGGMAVVTDPRTGEILAMANLQAGKNGGPPVPTADNMAVTRVFEPGSTNKVVTVAAALEEGIVDPSTRMNVNDSLRVADTTFGDAEPHPPMSWTTADIVAQSSNVGTIQIAQRLGKARISNYLDAFGLTDRTGLRFPGESGGLIPEVDKWSGTSIGSIPIGQGVAVTAVQMLSAYNAMANGGTYVAPSLLKTTVSADGKTHPAKAPATHRVVSAETAGEVTKMLTGVVSDGTGTAARIEGYTVAGKTGTARKPSETKAGYSDNYMASFVGFVPAEAPRLSAIVVLDEPTPYFGGIVSAPVFAAIAGFGIRHFQIPARPAPAPTGAIAAGATPGLPPTKP